MAIHILMTSQLILTPIALYRLAKLRFKGSGPDGTRAEHAAGRVLLLLLLSLLLANHSDTGTDIIELRTYFPATCRSLRRDLK